NARIVSRVGDRYVVESVGYNDAVAAGAVAVFGFQGAGASGTVAPVSINGVAFEDGGDAPAPMLPSVLVADASAAEEDGEITFDLSLSGPAAGPVEVAFETIAGTAAAGADFSTTTGSVVFAAGQTETNVTIALNDDDAAEATERFELRLTAADGAEIADGEATGTILDGDGGSGDDGMGGGYGDGGSGDDGGSDGGSSGGGSGPFVGGGQTYVVGQIAEITGFDPTRDMLDLGPASIHNQIPVDTPDGFMMLHMFNPSDSTLVRGVRLADLHPENFAPIADSHLQQDMSAILAYEDGSGLTRPNTVYARSHEQGVVEVVDFDPATDTLSFFYLSVRGDGGLNFRAEQTAEGARFWNPLTGQSLTLRDVDFADLDSSHFEWRANQLEDGIAGRMGLDALIDGFSYPAENVFGGKSVAMAGLVDRAPYHSQPDYTGTPIGQTDDGSGGGDGGDMGDGGSGDDGMDDGGADPTPIVVTVTGGSVTESDPGMTHMHGDGSSHVHDDGHRFITFQVSLDAPASEEVTLSYATADGTAVADTTNAIAWDYHETTGDLVFAPGDQTKSVTVAVHPDNLVEGTETFTLNVAGDGATGVLQATGTIHDDDVAPAADLIAQAGETTFLQDGADAWTQVLFDTAMIDPIVALGPLSANGSHEAAMRVRNVTADGFEVQVDEWDHLDGWHTTETVSWLAVERGTHMLSDGGMLQAGRA
ncbi:MAG: Calx-beta domain-containing protein, partial [Pseudomonadota bacterium]